LHWHETPGLVGIHHQGRFYEFAPWNAQIFWDVHPWGSWRVSAQNSHHQVELVGSTDRPGTWVRTPTAQGLIYHCRDTTLGHLTLTLQQRGSNKPLLQAESHLCGLEVGGDWNSPRSS
jgi:tocopherol cyclase